MRILAISYLFPNSQYPNYGIFVLNRLKSLQKYCDVQVVNPVPWLPRLDSFGNYRNIAKIPLIENIEGVTIYHPRFLKIPKYFKFSEAFTYKLAVMPLVEELYKSYPFDLVDLHWVYPDLPTGHAIKEKFDKKMLVTLRGKEAFHIGQGIGRELIIRKYLLKADAVISLSDELQSIALEMGVEQHSCHVIRNGVDTSKFYYMDRNECREKLNLALVDKVILSVGSLNFRKGFDRIIKCLNTILEMDDSWKLYIIGSEGPDGDYRKELNQLINKLNLQFRVYLLGAIDNRELIFWYNAADLFCLASRGEGSPNVLNEALCCGCPVVATDVGSVREIISEEYLGDVISNEDDIQTGLLAGLQKKFDRKKIAEYMLDYDWDWCARQVLSVYEQILSKDKKA